MPVSEIFFYLGMILKNPDAISIKTGQDSALMLNLIAKEDI
jgi:hypothetical protein